MVTRKLVVLLAGVMLLAGCSAPVAPAQPAAAQPAAASQVQTVDVASLARDIDSQTAAALREQPNVVILDVREQDEWDAGHIPGAVHIPMGEVPARIAEIPTDKTVIVQCRSGNRSSQITDFLRGKGMDNVHNLAGGLNAWSAAGLPVEQ